MNKHSCIVTVMNPLEATDLGVTCVMNHCDRRALFVVLIPLDPGALGEDDFTIYICRTHKKHSYNIGGE